MSQVYCKISPIFETNSVCDKNTRVFDSNIISKRQTIGEEIFVLSIKKYSWSHDQRKILLQKHLYIRMQQNVDM